MAGGGDVDRPIKGFNGANVEKFNKKVKERGIVYMSSVPKFMKPEKVRSILSRFGAVNRIYLVKEAETIRRKRIKRGGNRKANFVEGWIEFEDKRVAKRVARLLNATHIGGKKTDHFYDDMWNLKYLKSFQWSHLTEKVAYENRIRNQKLNLDISQAKKENAIFMARVDQSNRHQKQGKQDPSIHRVFKQTASHATDNSTATTAEFTQLLTTLMDS